MKAYMDIAPLNTDGVKLFTPPSSCFTYGENILRINWIGDQVGPRFSLVITLVEKLMLPLLPNLYTGLDENNVTTNS
jgi:hypothetical protein